MPRVSRYHLSQKEIHNLSEQFAYLVVSLKNKSHIEEFLQEFLTPEEKVMLAKRLVLYMLLAKNIHYKTIQSSLNISYETIRNYQHKLPYKTVEFRETIRTLLRKNEIKEFMKKFERVLNILSTISSSKTNMKARRKILFGE